VTFDLEVIECNRKPEWSKPTEQPVTTTMQPGRCMYLHVEEAENLGEDLVLSAETDNYADWWPAKYLYVEPRVLDDKSQQWYMSPQGYIYNAEAGPNYTLSNDWGLAMIASINPSDSTISEYFPKERRQWFYDAKEGDLTCDLPEQNWVYADKNTVFNRNALGVFGKLANGSEAKIGLNALVQESAAHTLRIEYCSKAY